MKIKIENIDGKKKYWVNDVAYDRIQDMPVQFQEYFKDANNNGIPDQFDDLMNVVNKMPGGSGALGGLFDTVRSESKRTAVSGNANYSPGEEPTSITPTLLKVAAAIAVVGLVAWLYPRFTGSNDPTNAAPAQILRSDSITDQSEISDQGDMSQPVGNGEMILTIDDPNEPPYHMLGIVSSHGVKVLTFELPDGEMDEASNASLQISLDVEPNTNLDERTFRVDLTNRACALEPNEVDDGKVMIGKNKFTRSKQGDGGMGQFDETVRYSIEKNEQCIVFSLILHSGNPATYDPPVKEFDFDKQVAYLENILATIKLP